MQNLLLIEEVDVRRLSDPEDSRADTITKMALPGIVFKTAEHTAGGGVGTVKYRLPMIEALEPTFSVKGIDRGSAQGAGLVVGARDAWMFSASVRDTSTNELLPLRGLLAGTVCEWKPGEHTPGDLLDCDHALHEVTAYELTVGAEQWIKFATRPRTLILRGVDIYKEYNEALGLA